MGDCKEGLCVASVFIMELFVEVSWICVYVLFLLKSAYFNLSLGFCFCYWAQQGRPHNTMKLADP